VTVFTIGHSTRALDAFIALLKEAGVTGIVDVRRMPHSRRYPHFDRETLAPALAESGIRYHHSPGLGGRRGRAESTSRNTLWREEGFRNFADYAETPAFDPAFAELRGLAQERPTAILCAEAVWWRCHRRIIADYLLAAGEKVEHILAPGRIDEARLTEGARLLPGGKIRYAERDLFNAAEGKSD